MTAVGGADGVLANPDVQHRLQAPFTAVMVPVDHDVADWSGCPARETEPD